MSGFDFVEDMKSMAEVFRDVMLEEVTEDPWWRKVIPIMGIDRKMMSEEIAICSRALATPREKNDEKIAVHIAIVAMLLYQNGFPGISLPGKEEFVALCDLFHDSMVKEATGDSRKWWESKIPEFENNEGKLASTIWTAAKSVMKAEEEDYDKTTFEIGLLAMIFYRKIVYDRVLAEEKEEELG